MIYKHIFHGAVCRAETFGRTILQLLALLLGWFNLWFVWGCVAPAWARGHCRAHKYVTLLMPTTANCFHPPYCYDNRRRGASLASLLYLHAQYTAARQSTYMQGALCGSQTYTKEVKVWLLLRNRVFSACIYIFYEI